MGVFFFFFGGGGVLYFEIFLGVLEIPDIFFFLGGGVNGRCLARAFV